LPSAAKAEPQLKLSLKAKLALIFISPTPTHPPTSPPTQTSSEKVGNQQKIIELKVFEHSFC
jgi:hypothetical protein